MTDRQVQVLNVLGHRSLTAAQVAAHIGLLPHQAQRILDGLYRRTWATLTPQSRWVATERGRAKIGIAPSVRTQKREQNATKPRMSRNLVAPNERELFGVIVTAREQGTGRMISLSRNGPARKALKACCDALDERDGDWRVLTVSTPGSIWRDLQGTREVRDADRGAIDHEANALGQIGRADMLER